MAGDRAIGGGCRTAAHDAWHPASGRAGCSAARASAQVMTDNGLEAVFMANRAQITRFVRARGAAEDAEDIVQEVWIKAMGAPTGPIADPLPYLYRMADNLLLDRRRSQHRRARRELAYDTLDDRPAPGVSAAPSADRVLVARERLRIVEATLAALGARTATIFRRYRIDGASQRDIAAELGLSLSAVEKHLQKAYRALIDLRTADDADLLPPRRLAIKGIDDDTGRDGG